ncbi:hypothetical protein SAMN07250955_1234 [Arboricoccus pini]|uniref:Ribbon-helix-helix protein, copG family n=1 Tax=Arboricoccus pini TaxID=1963835 RepID=A0A212S3S2_9PROT|nr:hypothetical protein [Arboricoccus pini]SNB79786.1 hypothetical protein SAMN07250955_1234 [Arboricoccus pini]
MAKPKVTAANFLKNLDLPEPEPAAPAKQAPARVSAAKKDEPEKPAAAGRVGLKHIGGYFDRDTVEMVAVLRARLGLDNSQLIKRAVEELYSRETAARKFGDR